MLPMKIPVLLDVAGLDFQPYIHPEPTAMTTVKKRIKKKNQSSGAQEAQNMKYRII